LTTRKKKASLKNSTGKPAISGNSGSGNKPAVNGGSSQKSGMAQREGTRKRYTSVIMSTDDLVSEVTFTKKNISPSLIFSHLKRFSFNVVLEPLYHTSNLASYFKVQNKIILANDPLEFSFWRGKAIVENNNIQLTQEEQTRLLPSHPAELEGHNRFWDWRGFFFSEEQCKLLDFIHVRINQIRDDVQRSSAYLAMMMVINYWLSARDHRECPKWDNTEIIKYYLSQVTKAMVIDNHEVNEMWNLHPTEMIAKNNGDVLYINLPKLAGVSELGYREQIWQSWITVDPHMDMNTILKPGTCLGARFDTKEDFLEELDDFLANSQHISIWAFSISPQIGIPPEDIIDVISNYRHKVNAVKTFQHHNEIHTYFDASLVIAT
jgi:hypothetical protein